MRRFIPIISVISILGLLLLAGPCGAATAIIKDGNTLQLAGVSYRLDGIDAPEFDQICIDNHADSWSCGVDARDHLTKLIGGRAVRCEDHGPAKKFRKRHLGVCTVEGETASLNLLLIRQGFAIDVDPSVKSPYRQEEAAAKDGHQGLWKGCFAAPQQFRLGKKDGALLGDSCRADKDREIRAVLFPEHPVMPPRCSIKAKFAVRARVTGNVGIYHLQGCRSYPALTRPDRWFCSEDDAQAAGFRRAYNCRAGAAGK